jgi:hypothetical protein
LEALLEDLVDAGIEYDKAVEGEDGDARLNRAEKRFSAAKAAIHRYVDAFRKTSA